MLDQHIFEAICNAMDIPPEERGLVRQMVELDAQDRAQLQQERDEAWEHIKRAMDKERQRLTEMLRALSGEDVRVEWENVDDA